MNLIGIDPGSEESAYCIIDTKYNIIEVEKIDNNLICPMLDNFEKSIVVIESIQSYSMPVGKNVFDTAYLIGKIMRQCEISGLQYALYPRPEYASAICGCRAKDSVLRRALATRFGDKIIKQLTNTDKRSAFAVAVYHIDKSRNFRV